LEGTWDVVELTRSDLASKVFPTEDMTGIFDFKEDTLRFAVPVRPGVVLGRGQADPAE
jgi:hypothetical protein